MIYLDNSATTRPFDRVVQKMAQSMGEGFFNPSSLYAQALLASDEIKRAKGLISAALGGVDRVALTGGGTEADNLAILGLADGLRGRKAGFITTSVEHPAVLECFRRLQEQGHETYLAPVDASGVVRVDELVDHVGENTALVSVMQINNEVGALQPIAQIAARVKEKNPKTLVHVDGVQGFLRQSISLRALGVDLYSLSAHKIHGPKGVGALAMVGKPPLAARMLGGGQEEGLRSGTENMPGIVGLAEAIACFNQLNEAAEKMFALKLRLAEGLLRALPESRINGPAPELGAPHILNVSFPVRGEVLLHALEGEGILVSTGSACSSHKRQASPVLTAMGLDPRRLEGAIRFSLCPFNTQEEIDRTIEATARCVQMLKRFKRR